MSNPVIALITDFGLSDNYAGVLKAVILNIVPNANIIDLTHDINRHNIRQAAFVLLSSVKYFPKGTIFVAVVDPGVGSDRKVIAIKSKDYYFIGPDNGTFSMLWKDYPIEKVYSITNRKYMLDEISSTFQGRDIMAPAAAHLAKGVKLEDLGVPFNSKSLIKIPEIKVRVDHNKMCHAEVVYIDKFGNLITSISKTHVDECLTGSEIDTNQFLFEVNQVKIYGLSNTYSDVKSREFVAYFGSGGFLEIGMRDGNASLMAEARIGHEIKAKILPKDNLF
jgi:S-adenosylmethionine hydrolase